MNNPNGVRCTKLGIGASPSQDTFKCIGGNAYFNCTVRFDQIPTFNSSIYVSNSGRIFQRVDVNNSLNVISTNEINFSLQSNRTTDPTTGTIALQLNDTNGITLNRAVVNNQTFNSIGLMTAEAGMNVWGDLNFQHSSGIKETLNGVDYDLDIRNGDTDRAINFIIGTIGSTPELSLSEAKVKINSNLEITQETISTVDQIQFLNTDTGGEFAFYFGSVGTGTDKLAVSPSGILVNGDIEYTGSLVPSSDKRLKKDIKELDQKKAVELVKYIVPKTYHFIDDRQEGKSCVGFVANDVFDYKGFPKEEWGNIVKKGKDGYLKFDYTATTPVLWSALQYAINKTEKIEKEKDELVDLVKSMKKDITTMKGEITKLKNEVKGKGNGK